MAVAGCPGLKAGLALASILVFGGESVLADSVLLQEERARRSNAAATAYGELQQGDESYRAGEYADAMALYAAARGRLSAGPATDSLRTAATERYAQAAVAHGKELRRAGKTAEAIKLMEEVLAPAVAPDYAPAETLLDQLRDPIRTNPVLTADHVQDIEAVRKDLYRAEGYLSLGQYDEAFAVYERVLRIDPTNTAARRGMEQLNAKRTDYYRAAFDETRSRMLAEVAKQWEIPPTPEEDLAALVPTEQIERVGASLYEKLNGIVIERVNLDQIGLREAVDYLRQFAFDLDTTALNDEERGVDFVIDLGGDPELAGKIEARRFDLNLQRAPLNKLLDYITAASGTEYTLEQFAIVIRPAGAVDDRLYTRSFRVPPDILSREAVSRQVEIEDPFADDDGAPAGLLGKKMTARDFLEEQGVSFPEGATATLQPGTSLLRVRNTNANLDYVEQIVDAINAAEPVAVIVEATFIEIREEILNELGFDWLLNPIGGELMVGGGTTGSGQPINDFGVPFAGQTPVTSGLRSGDRSAINNNIDNAINRVRTANGSGNAEDLRAPGIMNVTAIFDDDAVSMMMRGLANAGGDDRMIKKTVVTRSGQTASVEATRSFIYPTEYEPPELPSNVGATIATDLSTGASATATAFYATPATPTAFDTRKVGCELEVEPLVGPDRRYIELSVRPTVTEFDGFIDYGTPITGGQSSIDFAAFFGGAANFQGEGSFGEVTANNILQPIFSTTRANTNLVLLDGATVVLGGMLGSTHQIIEDKVPILGDIPLVGRLFQSETDHYISKATVILVKVSLVDPTGQPFRDN